MNPELEIYLIELWTQEGGEIKLHPTDQGHLEAELSVDYAGFLKLTGEKSKIMVVGGARFCYYFTPSIRIPLISDEGTFFNKTQPFLKITA